MFQILTYILGTFISVQLLGQSDSTINIHYIYSEKAKAFNELARLDSIDIIYIGLPEKITFSSTSFSILKERKDFEKTILFHTDCNDYVYSCQFKVDAKEKKFILLKLLWLERNKTLELKLDTQYSKIEVNVALDLTVEEIFFRGKDENGIPIPIVKLVKIPDEIYVHYF